MTDFAVFHKFVSHHHADQVDKDGSPYIDHLERVARHTRRLAQSLPQGMISAEEMEYAVILALLHDTLEDKKATEEEIISVGGSEAMISDLRMLARPEGPNRPTYQDWIMELCENAPLAVLLTKLGDNADNGDPLRLQRLPKEMSERFARKYAAAKEKMLNELDRRIAAFSQPRHAAPMSI